MLGNNEIKALIIALGTGIGETFDLEKIRYKRIVIMTDADVDGAHIRTLLLTLFYRYFKEVIEAGYLFIAQPPLYKLSKGKQTEYVFTEDAKAGALAKWGVTVEADEEEADENEDAELAMQESTEVEGKPGQ